ncbi:hypothetical protein [Crossiella sp. NPDC003009]
MTQNNIVGPVSGIAVQAHTITVTVEARELLDRLRTTELAWVGSRVLEERARRIVAYLYEALIRAFGLIGTQGREAARETHARARQQIGRAEADQQRAAVLVAVLGRRLMGLQSELAEIAPELAAGFAPPVVCAPEEALGDINRCLDQIELLLGEQEKQLAGAANTVTLDERVRAADLIAVLTDTSISASHRLRAAQLLGGMGKRYIEDVALGLRLLLTGQDDPAGSVTAELTLLGGRFRVEAAAVLQQRIEDDRWSTGDRIRAAGELLRMGDIDPGAAVRYLKGIATAEGDEPDLHMRTLALRSWWKYSPGDRPLAVKVAQELGETTQDAWEREAVAEFLRLVETLPALEGFD